jgi:hypothetical protein
LAQNEKQKRSAAETRGIFVSLRAEQELLIEDWEEVERFYHTERIPSQTNTCPLCEQEDCQCPCGD